MSYPAKKTLIQPIWVVLLSALFLLGCKDEGDSRLGDASGDEDAEQVEDDGDDGQEIASEMENAALLMWQAPVQRENGDSLKDGEIAHFVVSWGQDPENLDQTETVECASCQDMEHTIEELDEGDWYFSVQTVDTEGNVSRRADPVNKAI